MNNERYEGWVQRSRTLYQLSPSAKIFTVTKDNIYDFLAKYGKGYITRH